MGEFHGQILGLVIVIAIFAAITPVMISLFNGLANDVVAEAEEYTQDVGDGKYNVATTSASNDLLRVAGLDIKVMSFAD